MVVSLVAFFFWPTLYVNNYHILYTVGQKDALFYFYSNSIKTFYSKIFNDTHILQ